MRSGPVQAFVQSQRGEPSNCEQRRDGVWGISDESGLNAESCFRSSKSGMGAILFVMRLMRP